MPRSILAPPRPAPQPPPRAGNRGSLLLDAEAQLERFNVLFKELCRQLTSSQEQLGGQHMDARSSLAIAERDRSSFQGVRYPTFIDKVESRLEASGRASTVLARGHLNDPNPDFEGEEGKKEFGPKHSVESMGSGHSLSGSVRDNGKTTFSEPFQNPQGSVGSESKFAQLRAQMTNFQLNAPEAFEVNDYWHVTLQIERSSYPRGSGSSVQIRKGRASSLQFQEQGDYVTSRPSFAANLGRCFCPRRCLLNPNQPIRLLWDMLGVAFMISDLVWLPLLMCGAPDSQASTILAWTVRIYWTFDIPTTFTTGFVDKDGVTVMDIQKAGRRYLKTWLFLDFFLVLIDWIEMVLTVADGLLRSARFGKLMRLARVIRMVRLMRLAKLPGIMTRFLDNIFAERTVMVMSIAKITFIFVAFNHIIACIWFKLGADSDDDMNWLEQNNLGSDITEHSYIVSLHWATCCFIGNMEIVAINTGERAFSAAVLITTFLLSASFVSVITTSITSLQIIQSKEATHFSMLRTFLRAQAVNAKLAVRITKNAQYAAKSTKNKVHEKDVELLAMIPNSLMLEMHYDMYSRALRTHVLFNFYCALSQVAMARVCHLAISTVTITTRETLFRAAKRPDPPSMLFVTQGTLAYLLENSENVRTLYPTEYACEATLWLASWVHRGKLITKSDSTVLRLLAERFQQIMVEEFHPMHPDHPAWYALRFVNYMRELEPELVTDLDCGLDQTCLTERHQQFDADEAESKSHGFKISLQKSLSACTDSVSGSTSVRGASTSKSSSHVFRMIVQRTLSAGQMPEKPRLGPVSLKMIATDPDAEMFSNRGHGSTQSVETRSCEPFSYDMQPSDI